MISSRLITVVTFGSLVIAGVIGAVWFLSVHGAARFEPAVSSLGLLAGLTGVLAERRATARERRHLALTTLADELDRNRSALDDIRHALAHERATRPRIYPRLAVSAVDVALTSGALADKDDTQLLASLHTWRDKANGCNRRLDLTEMRIFTGGKLEEVAELKRVLHRDQGYLNHLNQLLTHLQDTITSLLPQHHPLQPRSPQHRPPKPGSRSVLADTE